MSTAQYEIYRRKVLDLAHTMVVKSRATADAINTHLDMRGVYVNDRDPYTWKYYLNLNGQYHSSDERMSVRSLDTLQIIEFSRDNLLLHRATAREYVFGSSFYQALVERYPEQETLIRGIMNPVEMDVAIEAEDGQILYYDEKLVEENETNLIPQLDAWSRQMFHRWNLTAYAAVDNLYAASFLAVYYTQVPLAIMNIRQANCHTIYAHSFHILEFLAGQGRLDRYADALTRRQLLWLYRNIRYIHRNVGKHATFELLMQNIMTERGFPLAAWNMEHNTADMLDEVYPDIEYSLEPLNIKVATGSSATIDTERLLAKEIPGARSNDRGLDEAEATTVRRFEDSLSSRLTTKVLESEILDLTDAYPYTTTDALLNNWMYLSHKERYRATIYIEEPKSGARLTLTVKEAFLLYLYLWNKSRGWELPTIPMMAARMIRRDRPSTYEELRRLVPRECPPEITNYLLDNSPTLAGLYISTEAFYLGSMEVHSGYLRQRMMWQSRHDHRHNGWARVQGLHLYEEHHLDLGAGALYSEWLADRSLDFREYTAAECGDLALEIYRAATGLDLRLQLSLKDMQGAMLRLMAQLSSYSVQFIQTINEEPMTVMDWPAIAPTHPDTEADGEHYGIITRVQPLCKMTEVSTEDFVDMINLTGPMTVETTVESESIIHIGLNLSETSAMNVESSMHIARIDKLSEECNGADIEDVIDRDTENYVPGNRLPLENAFLTLETPQYVLSDEDRDRLRDLWDLVPPIDPIRPVIVLPGHPYEPIVLRPVMDGFHLPVVDGGVLEAPPMLPPVAVPPVMDVPAYPLNDIEDVGGVVHTLQGDWVITLPGHPISYPVFPIDPFEQSYILLPGHPSELPVYPINPFDPGIGAYDGWTTEVDNHTQGEVVINLFGGPATYNASSQSIDNSTQGDVVVDVINNEV